MHVSLKTGTQPKIPQHRAIQLGQKLEAARKIILVEEIVQCVISKTMHQLATPKTYVLQNDSGLISTSNAVECNHGPKPMLLFLGNIMFRVGRKPRIQNFRNSLVLLKK